MRRTRLLDLSSLSCGGELPLEVIRLALYSDRPSTRIKLGNNKPGFTLPSTIGELGDITKLDLSGCSLQGPCRPSSTQKRSQSRNFPHTFPSRPGAIPPELARLTNLKELNLGVNELSGTFADSLAMCMSDIPSRK